MDRLHSLLAELDSAIEYEEANDRAYTKEFVILCKQRNALAKAVKKIDKLQAKLIKWRMKESA